MTPSSNRPQFSLIGFALLLGILLIGQAHRLLRSYLPSAVGAVAAAEPAQAPGGKLPDSAIQQIQALLTEKAARTAAQRKLDSQLVYALKLRRGEPLAPGVPTLLVEVEVDPDGKTVVDITAAVSDSLLRQLEAGGAEIIEALAAYNSIRARLALTQLEAIAVLPAVRFIQPKQTAKLRRRATAVQSSPVPMWHDLPAPGFAARAERVRTAVTEALQERAAGPTVGSRNSQGDATHRANSARTTFGVNGTGVRIGVLSDGATSLAASQAAGDLPANVTVLPGQVGSGDEGTAMLEIIHDLAPGAQLFFATAFNSLPSFAQNIRNLRAAGCDIIVDDVIYFVESPFQDGQTSGVLSTTNGAAIAQAVNDVTAGGALYFSSAGNEGNKNDNRSGVWEGDFADGGANALLPGGTVHDFGGTLFDTITVGGGAPGHLFWADTLGGAANDYDLFILNSAGTSVVASSTNVQSGTQDPFEQVSSTAMVTNNRVVVLRKTGAAGRFLHATTNGGQLTFNTAGVTRGHACAAEAYGVAATPAAAAIGAPPNPVGPFPNPFSATNTVELFSSDGPRRFFFQPNGTPITPGNFSATGGLLRPKPDITAADGVSVTGVGGFATTFYGTSAAAPHAGAIAALLKSANPALTPAQIRTALTGTAIDIEAAGADRDSGAGIIMAFEALQSIGVMPSANFEVGTVAVTERLSDSLLGKYGQNLQ